MIPTDASLLIDIEKVKQITIVPTILDVICKSTGMGFAAVARVTQDRWIACSVQDEINFGLKPGGELQIETTICNEIRDTQKAVVIDHVAQSDYVNHHTPRLYGFQSYISFPIFLKSGEFFGTLCAIDPKPAVLDNAKILGMFNLFADLIAFHLQSMDLLDRSNVAVKELSRKLTDSADENRQYRHISDHNLQEPLRKIRMFSDMLVHAAENKNLEKSKELAVKVSSNAQRFSMMIKDLSDFSELAYQESSFQEVNLNKVVTDVCEHLKTELNAKSAVINLELLPSIYAIPLQMEQLFFHLISNAVKFSKPDTSPVIHIFAKEIEPQYLNNLLPATDGVKYIELRLEDNGMGIEKSQLEKIFDIFSQLSYDDILESKGIGLTYCRKIIRNHGGLITAESEVGKGTSFSMILPLTQKTDGDLLGDSFKA